jgi:hypothetical protein
LAWRLRGSSSLWRGRRQNSCPKTLGNHSKPLQTPRRVLRSLWRVLVRKQMDPPFLYRFVQRFGRSRTFLIISDTLPWEVLACYRGHRASDSIFRSERNIRKSFLFTRRISDLRSTPSDLATLHWLSLQIGKPRKKHKIAFPSNLYRKVYSNAISSSLIAQYAVGRTFWECFDDYTLETLLKVLMNRFLPALGMFLTPVFSRWCEVFRVIEMFLATPARFCAV